MNATDIIHWIAVGELWRFYTSRTWKRQRKEVLALDNNECQKCKSQGKYKRATMVHHVNHLKDRPDLAMEVWYIDAAGVKRRQLLSLCDDCHEEEHPERMRQNKPKPEPWPERWD